MRCKNAFFKSSITLSIKNRLRAREIQEFLSKWRGQFLREMKKGKEWRGTGIIGKVVEGNTGLSGASAADNKRGRTSTFLYYLTIKLRHTTGITYSLKRAGRRSQVRRDSVGNRPIGITETSKSRTITRLKSREAKAPIRNS